MIWLIAKKDFLLNLLSVRFVIGFVLCLFVIPFTLVVGGDGYLDQVRMYKVDKERADNNMKNIREYSRLRPYIIKEPAALSIFSKGITGNIGNRKRIEVGEVPLFLDGKTATRDNPFLNAFFSLDFSTVIAILISLLALVFSYDAITREREDGTMKLTFTGQVGRITFLFGKLAGVLLTLLPILLFCYLLACLVVVLNPAIAFSAADWGGIVLLLATSLLYMLVFVLLGMFISTLSHSSSTSVIVSLLCWIWFLFLVPSISCYLSQTVAAPPLYDNVANALEDIDNRLQKECNEKLAQLNVQAFYFNFREGSDGYMAIYGGNKSMILSHQRYVAWKEPARIAYADKKWAVQKKYQDDLLHQQRVQQYFSWLSPSELFRQATQQLCRTDAGSYLRYMETIRRYRETFLRYLEDRKAFDSLQYITGAPLSSFFDDTRGDGGGGGDQRNKYWFPDNCPALDLADMPHYEPGNISFPVTVGAALGRMAALLAVAVALLLGTIAVFMKYDVR